jgi:GDP-L-fucose synthase
MDNILVFGGSGMVGSALKEVETDLNLIFLSSKDADLTSEKETQKIFKDFKPEGVINLAANCGGLYKNLKQGIQLFDDNIAINSNVLKYSYGYGVKKVISCLSVCIFPELDESPWVKLPMTEKDVHSGPPHFSNDCYAYSKRMVDVLSKKYRSRYNKNFVTITPTNIFGPFDNFSEEGHVIPGLIKKAVRAKTDNSPFIVKGTGSSLRQFIYSKDLAKLILWAYKNYNDDETIIFSPDENSEISIREIAQIIARIVGIDEILYDVSYSDGQHKRTVSNEKLRTLYPEFQFTPMEKALEETIDWFITNKI